MNNQLTTREQYEHAFRWARIISHGYSADPEWSEQENVMFWNADYVRDIIKACAKASFFAQETRTSGLVCSKQYSRRAKLLTQRGDKGQQSPARLFWFGQDKSVNSYPSS